MICTILYSVLVMLLAHEMEKQADDLGPIVEDESESADELFFNWMEQLDQKTTKMQILIGDELKGTHFKKGKRTRKTFDLLIQLFVFLKRRTEGPL